MTLDAQTIFVLGLIFILIIVILFLSVKFSKKILRSWLKEKEDKILNSDKAFNTLLAVKTISKNFEAQGIDVSSVKRLIEDADNAMKLKNYTSSLELTERAKNLLIELKSKKEKGVDERAAHEVDAEEFKSHGKGDYEPTAKEILQKKYPENFLQAKFTVGLAETLLKNPKDTNVPLDEAKTLLEQSKHCFELEDYKGALRYSLQCKKLLEGEGIEVAQKPIPKTEKELVCSRCSYEAKEGDTFCRRCGNNLKD